jgi:hypothetical protein
MSAAKSPLQQSVSESTHIDGRRNDIKHTKATFKVLGELTGAPSVGSFIEEMEVNTFPLV